MHPARRRGRTRHTLSEKWEETSDAASEEYVERWAIEQCVKTGMHPVRRGRRQVAWRRASEEEGEQTGVMAGERRQHGTHPARRREENTGWHSTQSVRSGGDRNAASVEVEER